MKKLIAVFLLIVFPATLLFAWGPKGHQIVGDIARTHLNEAARQNIVALLGNDDLAAVANWADDVKGERRESYGWHFVDIRKDSSGFSQPRDCYQPNEKFSYTMTDHHNCVVDRINMFREVLADKNAPRQDRIDALKFLVHFVGDIHQPLHAIDEARGGNDIHVVEFGSAQCGTRPCNLHYEWDIALLEHTGRSEADYVSFLERLITSNHLQLKAGGTAEDWANESFAIAKQIMLKDGGAVDDAYYKANIGTIDERLALGGLRLARWLNETLGSTQAH
ncbi:MAG TPA: S1/P1 nuclease [Candidatus Angelobacter sp.]|nr:S1/P1 nuclease [Candidatus Angelobacter sp.]